MTKNVWKKIYHYLTRFSEIKGLNTFQRYNFAFLLVAIFFSFKTVLFTSLGFDVPFILTLFIVTLSVWVGGLGPGIFATVLSGALTYYFFLEPKQAFFGAESIASIIYLVIFLIEGILVSIIIKAHRDSDRKRTEFLGIISHELKNPLTSVKGYAQMIEHLSKQNPRVSTYAKRIDNQVNQVTQMVNEMLDVTKIETGRLTYHDEQFKIYDLVKEVISDEQVTTDTHKISLSGKSDKTVLGDRYRIAQVITNLISNAIKYSPNAKKVVVTVQNSTGGIRVSVEDFGYGIRKEDEKRVFLPFFRSENTQGARGTGIGLFISSQIVARHKGKLWVKSRPGKGSIFYLWLPQK